MTDNPLQEEDISPDYRRAKKIMEERADNGELDSDHPLSAEEVLHRAKVAETPSKALLNSSAPSSARDIIYTATILTSSDLDAFRNLDWPQQGSKTSTIIPQQEADVSDDYRTAKELKKVQVDLNPIAREEVDRIREEMDTAAAEFRNAEGALSHNKANLGEPLVSSDALTAKAIMDDRSNTGASR